MRSAPCSSSSVIARNDFASLAWLEPGATARARCIASRASLTFPQAVSSPGKIVQDFRVVGVPSGAILEEAIMGPGEIVGLIRHPSQERDNFLDR